MDQIEEIKKRIDIVDFIGFFITLKKAGRNFKALCPFHQEKTPSFVISPERQIWHCFGSCGEGGDILKFLMKWENITFGEALRELADKAGIRLQGVTFEDKIFKKKERLTSLNNLAAEYFQYVLFEKDFGKKVLEYLSSRDINPKTAKKFQLGYAPKSWDSLFTFLKKKNFEVTEILEAGLIVKGERRGFYDRFRGRLIFPIKDVRGATIGFSGRNLDDVDKEAKYINTPETPLYHKRESLFGINLAKDEVKKQGNAYLVEGEFDVISPYQRGIENVVAIKGSAVTKEQLMFLKRYTPRVTLALDADDTGSDAVKRGIEESENLDIEIEVVQFDFAKDPDEAVRKDPKKFKEALKKSISVYDFIISYAQKQFPPDSAFNKKKVADLVVPYLDRIRNPIVQSHFVKKLAKLLDVSEGSIILSIKRLKQRQKQQQFFKPSIRKKEEEEREVNIQRYALSVLFQSENPYLLEKKFFNIVSASDFSIPSFGKVITHFLTFHQKHPNKFEMRKFVKELPAEVRSVFDELYLYASYEGDFEDENLEKMLYEIKKYALKRQIAEAVSSKEIEKEEEKKLRQLSTELKEVEKKTLSL